MKRVAIVVAVVLVAATAFAVWRLFGGTTNTQSAFAMLVPAGPIACPEDPNDLAGIEGWAPGAGRAEQAGQTNAGNMSGFAGALGGAPPTPAPSPSGGCTGLSSDLAARFDTIAADAKYVPTDGFDTSARADELSGTDAIFAYVRDAIHTEPYPGVMRGAAGTLQAQGGSPADKALLLGALYAVKQIPVRYVHTALTDSEIAMAISAAIAPPATPVPHDLSPAFGEMGVDVPAARAGAARVRARAQAGADAMLTASRAATDRLGEILASKNVPLATNDAAIRAGWSSALRDHWWLQVQQNGNWVDEDPTLPGQQSGTHLGGNPAGEPVDVLPDSLQTTMSIRLVAQRIAGSEMQITTLVSKTMKLSDVSAQPVVVTIGDRNGGSAAIATATSFTPSIGSAGSEETGNAFDTNGLARVEMQIDVQQPGEPLRSYRRTVVDRSTSDGKAIDPAWTPERTAYALTTVYDILPLSGDLDGGFTGLREIDGLKMLRGFMAYAAAGGNGKQMPPPASETYPMQALHYFEADRLLRLRLEDAAAPGTVTFFFDRPQIAMERRGFDFRKGVPASVTAFDIVENGMTATGNKPADAIRDNFTRGYADEYAEQHLFSSPNDGGTIAIVAEAQKQSIPIDVLTGPRYGGTAIGPASSVTIAGVPRIGWWQVDPQTGNLIGRMGPDGAGQALSEYAIARANDWASLYGMIQFYGDFFRCIAGAVEASLSGLEGAAAQQWFQQCAGAAICSYLESLTMTSALPSLQARVEITDLDVLLYNILDISYPKKKDSWPPTGGWVCGKFFSSPLNQ